MRSVAAAAGVDPALVHHYFGTKGDLFIAASALPLDPRELLAEVFLDGTTGAAERLLTTLTGVWDEPVMQEQLVAVFRAGLGGDLAGDQLLRDAVGHVILASVREHLTSEDAEIRVQLVATQVIGLIVARYVLRLEPMASLARDDVVRLVAPTVQRYLDGPLGEGSAAGSG